MLSGRQRPPTTLSLGHAGKQAPGSGRDECVGRGHQVIQQLPAIGPVPAAVIIAGIGDVTRFQNAARLSRQAETGAHNGGSRTSHSS